MREDADVRRVDVQQKISYPIWTTKAAETKKEIESASKVLFILQRFFFGGGEGDFFSPPTPLR